MIPFRLLSGTAGLYIICCKEMCLKSAVRACCIADLYKLVVQLCLKKADLFARSYRMGARPVLAAAFIIFAGSLSGTAQTVENVPVPPRRPALFGAAAPASPASGNSLAEGRKAERELKPSEPSVADCSERLKAAGIATERPAGTTATTNPACDIAEPVILLSAADPYSPGRVILFQDRPRLSCVMAERFARFTTDIVAPLARGTYGKELVAIATGPGHECRPRNRQPGAKLSSHAQGNAVDVSGVELSGRHNISVENAKDEPSKRFFTGFRAAACGAFTTVLGPGSDAAHQDHIHIDIEMRGHDGRSKFCQ